MTTTPFPSPTTSLSERIERSLDALYTLPGLGLRSISHVVGAPPAAVVASHWLHSHTSLKASLARTRVEAARALLHGRAGTVPHAELMRSTAEAVGFRSVEDMDRAFLRYRHRSSFDVLLSERTGSLRAG